MECDAGLARHGGMVRYLPREECGRRLRENIREREGGKQTVLLVEFSAVELEAKTKVEQLLLPPLFMFFSIYVIEYRAG